MSLRRHQGGFTLVEFMVSAVIGLLLVAVMGSVYLGSKSTFNSQDATSRLQENARFAMDTISSDLRMAGFRGCLGRGKATALTNTLTTPSSTLYNFSTGISASRNVASSWSPALDPAIAALAPAPSPIGSVFTVRRPAGSGWALISEMADASAPLTVSATSSLATGDLLMVTDCNSAAVFQASTFTSGATATIQHQSGTGLTPDMATSTLGRTFAQDALVYRMETVTYYLAPSARPGRNGTLALWSYTFPAYDGSVQPSELVTGVERMDVSLGIDTDGDQNADTYVSPEAVTDWSSVVSARAELLFASQQSNVATSPQSYTFGGVLQTPNDRRLRASMTTVSSLRNLVP